MYSSWVALAIALRGTDSCARGLLLSSLFRHQIFTEFLQAISSCTIGFPKPD